MISVAGSLPGAVIYQGQPATEFLGCLFGRCPIKGHQGGRHAREPFEFGAPARRRHRSHRYLVAASRNQLFEMVNVHGCLGGAIGCNDDRGSEDRLSHARYIDHKRSGYRSSVRAGSVTGFWRKVAPTFFSCLSIHSVSTNHPQVFNRVVLPRCSEPRFRPGSTLPLTLRQPVTTLAHACGFRSPSLV